MPVIRVHFRFLFSVSISFSVYSYPRIYTCEVIDNQLFPTQIRAFAIAERQGIRLSFLFEENNQLTGYVSGYLQQIEPVVENTVAEVICDLVPGQIYSPARLSHT